MDIMDLFEESFKAGRKARRDDRREMHSTGDRDLLATEGWEDDEEEPADKDLSVRDTNELEAYDA